MKTKFTLITWLLFSCAMLFRFSAQAQFTHFPTNGAPIFGQANVGHGLLQDLDQKTSPIWFKVNGNIVGPQPHNKMHPYVTPGSTVEVNFNVNKNSYNRYSLVSYTVSNTGLRKLYDYHSNAFNQIPPSPPVQGNSNQQQVLIPTCRFEVYFVKGAISTGWQGPVPAAEPAIHTGYDNTASNPYLSAGPGIPAGSENRIIDFSYGSTGECDTCPFVLVPEPSTPANCVYPRLLEVIDIPGAQQKELIFAVTNTINTDANGCGQGWPEIGDILFANIHPTNTTNNIPYFFRWDYQLGPFLSNYPAAKTGVPLSGMTNVYNLAPGYQGAFVFDQRNNHNNWTYDVYQEDIVRYKVSYTEYARLNTPNLTPKPQICIELSPKHPEPHTSLEPIHCFDIVFDCAEQCPTTGTNCERTDCAFTYVLDLRASQPELVGLTIFNDTGTELNTVTFTLPLLTGAEISALNPIANNTGTGIFTPSVSSDATNTYLTFTKDGGTFDQFDAVDFAFTLPQAKINAVSGNIPVNLATSVGPITQTFNILDPTCISPLPVELTRFTGQPANEGIVLNWSTASEKNNDHFDIERSIDGKNFEKIGIQKGKGTTSAASEYKFLDKHPQKGLNYYRLKQVDFDGTHEYSHIVKVTTEKGMLSLGVKLIPNPCSNENCSVLLQGVDTSKELVVEMKDLTGRTVLRQVIPADQPSFNLPKANLGKGVYILSAKNGQNFTYQKVIIQ